MKFRDALIALSIGDIILVAVMIMTVYIGSKTGLAAMSLIRFTVGRVGTYIFSAIISGIVIWIVSRRVTTPILQLADISERMCHLDFEARYTGNSKNEIGILGENINQLSDTLEHTISELKTANNE